MKFTVKWYTIWPYLEKLKFALKFSQFLGKMAYQIKSNWPTAVEGDPKAPFSLASTSW